MCVCSSSGSTIAERSDNLTHMKDVVKNRAVFLAGIISLIFFV